MPELSDEEVFGTPKELSDDEVFGSPKAQDLPEGYQRIAPLPPEELSNPPSTELRPQTLTERVMGSPWVSGTGRERQLEPIIPKKALDFAVEHTPNIYTAAQLLPPENPVRKFTEGFKDTLTETGSAFTTPETIAETAPLAAPVVGPIAALGFGAQALGAGAGKLVAALEQGNPSEAGSGAAEMTIGGTMVVPSGAHLFRKLSPRPTVPEPPPVREAVVSGEQVGLSKSVEALKAVEPKAEPVVREPAAETPPVEPDPVVPEPVTSEPLRPAQQVAADLKPEAIQAELATVQEQLAALPKPKTMEDLTAKNELTQRAYVLQEALRHQAEAKSGLLETVHPLLTAANAVNGAAKAITDPIQQSRASIRAKLQAARAAVSQAGKDAQAAGEKSAADAAATLETGAQAPAQASQEAFARADKALADAAATVDKAGGETRAPLAADAPVVKALNEALDLLRKTHAPVAHPASQQQEQAPAPEPIPAPEPAAPVRAVGAEPPGKGEVADPVTEPTPELVSMGGMTPGERLKSPMASATDALTTMAESGKGSTGKAFDLGRTISQVKERVSDTAVGLEAAAKYLQKKLEGKPVWDNWKEALGERHLDLSESAVNARKFIKTATKAVPDAVDREAISNYIDTGGNMELLARGAAESPARYKAGYERAQKLTPEQKVAAENLRNYFERRLEDAREAGILEDGLENYLHRIYEKDSTFRKGAIAELRSGLFTGQPGLAKKRIFQYDLEAEKAGLKPVKNFIERVATYDLALNKAIADRAAVKAMMQIKMADGRPMIDVGGGGKVLKGEPVEILPGVEFAPTKATLINRSARVNSEEPIDNRGDYKSFDHPALRKWKWAANDEAGKPILVQGDVLVHPEALNRLDTLLGKSRIRENPVGRAALNVSSTIKQTMLDLSLFHQTQIGVHGLEHRTFKPVTEIDFTDPAVRGLIKGGAVVGETKGHQMFSEGLSGSSLTKHIPWVGERIQRYQSYLFEDYIPRLKMAMGLHALERNKARFPNLSEAEVNHLTANQMNAAFGELNYEMMGRSKTMQDALRLTLLAPDFLEARTRFAGQALTKYGGRPNLNPETGKLQLGEQGQALLLGAATMYVTARIINKLVDDEYHFEPKNAFNVVYGGKSYGLRTVQGDLIHAVTEPGQFLNHRLNPVTTRPSLEFATGRDYFGRKRSLQERAQDLASTPIPISIKGLFSGREQNLAESFLTSMGLTNKRHSPSQQLHELATEWMEKNKIRTAPGEFIYNPEKDPFRQIKLAAEYYDVAAARSEIGAALEKGLSKAQIRQHFALSAKGRFVGSMANERKFYDSLTPDQKDAYQKSKEERRRIKATVDEALR